MNSGKLLVGKNAIITGAAGGIGRATVTSFAQHGCNVWACARTKNQEFEDWLSALSAECGVFVKPVYFDLSDQDALDAALKSVIYEKLPIDVLVNNAGTAHGGLLAATSIKELREVFEINFFSQVRIMQLVSKCMIRNKGGAIVNVASAGAMESQPGYLAYGSSKSSLIFATRTISKELAPFNIRVNAVAPGLTDTDMGHYKSVTELEKTISRTALSRMATPEEIADAILYLASDMASFVTGHILVADGGRL